MVWHILPVIYLRWLDAPHDAYIYCEWYDAQSVICWSWLDAPPLFLLYMVWHILPVICCRWLNAPPRPYIYCKWSDTHILAWCYLIPNLKVAWCPLYLLWMVWCPICYLLKLAWCSSPFSTVNGLTHPTCYLLKMAWCPAPVFTVNGLTHPGCFLLKVAWCPLPSIYCKWYDAPSVICWSWLDAPPLYL